MPARLATATLAAAWRRPPRSMPAAVLLAVLVALPAGCDRPSASQATDAASPAASRFSGSGTGPDVAGAPTSREGVRVPGAPNPGTGNGAAPLPEPGGGGAPGAPILIPARVDDQGRPLAEVTDEITSAVRDECGGSLCITLRTEHRNLDNFTACQFAWTEPAQRTTVARGSTVVIVSGTAPCDSPPGGETTTPSDAPSSGDASPTASGTSP
jgi:hypothetical protein